MKPDATTHKLFRALDGLGHATVPLVEIIANTRGYRTVSQFAFAATAVQRLVQKSCSACPTSPILIIVSRKTIPIRFSGIALVDRLAVLSAVVNIRHHCSPKTHCT